MEDGKSQTLDLLRKACRRALRLPPIAEGGPCYQAPELVSGDHVYNNKVDIWALGCILYELVTGKRLFRNDYAIEKYRDSNSPDIPHDSTMSNDPRTAIN